jgi:hypothetical protein
MAAPHPEARRLVRGETPDGSLQLLRSARRMIDATTPPDALTLHRAKN